MSDRYSHVGASDKFEKLYQRPRLEACKTPSFPRLAEAATTRSRRTAFLTVNCDKRRMSSPRRIVTSGTTSLENHRDRKLKSKLVLGDLSSRPFFMR